MNNNYYKYLKYRNKYLNLKKQLFGGGAKTINLDKYKPFFLHCIKNLKIEIGFNMYYDSSTDEIQFEITKGAYGAVSIPYNRVIEIHTHPSHYYPTWKYQPPTQHDYVGVCYSYFSGLQCSIVVEKEGIWFFKPSSTLIDEIKKIQPNASEIFSTRITEGVGQQVLNVTEQMQTLIDVIFHNTSFEGVNLNFSGINVTHILSQIFISKYVDEQKRKHGDEITKDDIDRFIKNAIDIIKTMSPDDLLKLNEHYHLISLEEYIEHIRNCVKPGMGFDVRFISWDDKLNIEIEMTQNVQPIFDQIKSRNKIINNLDTFLKNIDATQPNYIIYEQGN